MWAFGFAIRVYGAFPGIRAPRRSSGPNRVYGAFPGIRAPRRSSGPNMPRSDMSFVVADVRGVPRHPGPEAFLGGRTCHDMPRTNYFAMFLTCRGVRGNSWVIIFLVCAAVQTIGNSVGL